MKEETAARMMRLREAIPYREQELADKKNRRETLLIELEEFKKEEKKLRKKQTFWHTLIVLLSLITVGWFALALQNVEIFVGWMIGGGVMSILVSLIYILVNKNIKPYLDQIDMEVHNSRKSITELEKAIEADQKIVFDFKEELQKLKEDGQERF